MHTADATRLDSFVSSASGISVYWALVLSQCADGFRHSDGMMNVKDIEITHGRQYIRDRGTRPPKVWVGGHQLHCPPKVEWRCRPRGTCSTIPTLDISFDPKFTVL